MEETSEQFHRTCRGNDDDMHAQEGIRKTGSPSGDRNKGSTGISREPGWAVWGGREARNVPMKPGIQRSSFLCGVDGPGMEIS